MPFTFRRRIRIGRNTHLNVSKSGVSITRKVGSVTVNSRGRVSVRFGKGFGWRNK